MADPFPLWVGLMDTMEVVDGAEPRVSLSCESRLVDLERAEVRYTDADQQAEYPGDRFFEYVPRCRRPRSGCRRGDAAPGLAWPAGSPTVGGGASG